MKKTLSIVALFLTSLLSAQITLEHSYSSEVRNRFGVYKDQTSTFYIVNKKDADFEIYNEDHTLYKSFSAPIDSGLNELEDEITQSNFSVSKHVFNEDDKLEFFLNFYNQNSGEEKHIIFNEDGNLIKEFGSEYNRNFIVFHDYETSKNKLVINKGTSSNVTVEVYTLPTSTLGSKEVIENSKIKAFPNPVTNILQISNTNFKAKKVKVFDLNGKLVLEKDFSENQKLINLNVKDLSQGIYIYKIGNLTSKFIKN